MKKELDKSVLGLEWKTGWHPTGKRWRVDLAGLEGKHPRVIVEAELKKDDSATNVTKVWNWARDKKNSQPILFVQGFSKLYWQSKKRIRESAEFIGERMAEAGLRIDYESAKIRYRSNKNGRWVHFRPKTAKGFHAKEGAGCLRWAAQGLAKEVARLIRSTQ